MPCRHNTVSEPFFFLDFHGAVWHTRSDTYRCAVASFPCRVFALINAPRRRRLRERAAER